MNKFQKLVNRVTPKFIKQAIIMIASMQMEKQLRQQ